MFCSVPKPWPVAVFETQRPHMVNFVRNQIVPLLEDEECRRIIVRAPVKSGKREMVEYIAMRDGVEQPTRVHAFISAWHRKADEEQREELGHQNLVVFSICRIEPLNACLSWIQTQIEKGLQVVLHLDECDHGSGDKQLLSQLWADVRNNTKVNNILYSATPEEALYSGEVENDDLNTMISEMLGGHHVRYTPPTGPLGYFGPRKFIDEGLVNVAHPFFDNATRSLSDQGKEIMHNFKESIAANPRRNVIVLRLSYSVGGNKLENKAIHQFIRLCSSFPEMEDVDVIVDKEDEYSIKGRSNVSCDVVEWSNPKYWRRLATGIPIIIVIDQKSSRSTEWACHDRIFATHDFRNAAKFSTISQAVERVNHYGQKYGGFQPIRIYCHKKTLLLSADKIKYDAYTEDLWEGRKVNRRTSGDVEVYQIRTTALPHSLHPSYPDPVDGKTRDFILQELECYAKCALSARIKGRVVHKIKYETSFHAVTPDTWESLIHSADSPLRMVTRNKFKNPFPLSKTHSRGDDGTVPEGAWKGRLAARKGESLWRVLQYKDVKDVSSWGHTDIQEDGMDKALRVICYNNGVLGVAVRIDTGDREKVSTLKAFRSMYGPQVIKLKK